MKKIIFFGMLIASGFTYAKSNSEIKSSIPERDRVTTSSGYTYEDTNCCGTCFIHGTYTTIHGDNGQSVTYFTPSDSSTQLLNNFCLGEGNYQV